MTWEKDATEILKIARKGLLPTFVLWAICFALFWFILAILSFFGISAEGTIFSSVIFAYKLFAGFANPDILLWLLRILVFFVLALGFGTGNIKWR